MRDLDHVTELVEKMTDAPTFEEAAHALARWARELTECDSAIVRMRQPASGEHEWIPVAASSGTSPTFLRDEALVAGSECLCGRVATGRITSDLPCYTDGGSFMSDRFHSLLTDTPGEELGPIRGRCVGEGYASVAIIPLDAGGGSDPVHLGVLHLAACRTDVFFPHRELLEAAGRVAARLLRDHKQHDSERAALDTIKEALLPAEPPEVPGLDLGFFATTADSLVRVGGDFYDVLVLPSGKVALVAGDYSGKGLDAAGTAARLRMDFAALAPTAEDPSQFMGEANGVVTKTIGPGRFASAICCTLDPGAGTMQVCLAGHPAPLLLRDGTLEELVTPSNLPLGVAGDRRFESATFQIVPGDLLALYTDGVTESRRDGRLFGIDGVARVLREEADATLPEAARRVVSRAALHHDPGLPDDDRLVLLARVAG